MGVLCGVDTIFFDLALIRGHVIGGVLIGGKEIQIGEFLLLLVSCSIILEQNEVAFLLNVDAPGVLSSSDGHDGLQKLQGADHTFIAILVIHDLLCFLAEEGILKCADGLNFVFLVLFEGEGIPVDFLDFGI